MQSPQAVGQAQAEEAGGATLLFAGPGGQVEARAGLLGRERRPKEAQVGGWSGELGAQAAPCARAPQRQPSSKSDCAQKISRRPLAPGRSRGAETEAEWTASVKPAACRQRQQQQQQLGQPAAHPASVGEKLVELSRWPERMRHRETRAQWGPAAESAGRRGGAAANTSPHPPRAKAHSLTKSPQFSSPKTVTPNSKSKSH